MSDTGLISLIEREHIKSLLDHGKRTDGRGFEEYRKITIVPGYIPKAEGSAIVKIGRTKVIAGVKASIGDPFPDTLEEGVVNAAVELVPIAAPEFESGPPDEKAIELARVADRAIRESQCVNMDSLIVIPSKKVWVVFIDIYVLDHDGNLFDACELGAIAALLNTRLPECKISKDAEGKDVIEILEKTKPLKIDHVPISCTFAKIGNHLIIDPVYKEESTQDARLTFAFTEDNKICATQKGESGSFSLEEIKKCIDIAAERTKELRNKLKEFTNPDGNAWSEDK